MIKSIEQLLNEISKLDISDDKRDIIVGIANKINKDLAKAEFKTKMLNENANTSKILLNNIISDINNKNRIIQEINEELEAADEELRQSNEELQMLNENIFNQKNIIEEKEQRLKTIIENQGEGVGITDFNENFIFTNTMACNIFNVPKGKLTGRNLREFLDDSEWEAIKKESEKRKQNIHSNYELNIRLDDNTRRTLLVTTAPDYNDKKEIIGTIGTFSDITERKKKQDKLKQLNIELNKYFTAVGQSPLVIIFTDINGNIEYVNSLFIEKTGYTFEEVHGKTPAILKSGQTPEATYTELWDTIVNGKVWKGEFINKSKNGELFIERAVISPVKDSSGKIINFVSLKEDITELKKTEQELIDSENRFKALSNATFEALFITENGYCIDANEVAGQMFYYKHSELIGKSALDIIAPESKDLVKDNMSSGYEKPYDAIVQRKDGSKFYAEIRGRMFEYRQKKVRFTAIRDISIRKEAEQAIKNSELELKQQKEKIEVVHKSITDSIDYAKRIQQALLPTERTFEESFDEHFIFYKPRDIVSGDFYWAKKINFLTTGDDGIVFSVADCTGHGVPGAFLSMLGISFLNEIVRTLVVENASDALNYLRKMVKSALKQKGELLEQKDGMDMVFCTLNKRTLELIYAGANNPLYILRKHRSSEDKNNSLKTLNENKKIEIYNGRNQDASLYNYHLIEIKPDRQPIGVHLEEKPFTGHQIQLQKGDILYAFSDGYADQFNGITKKKFKSTRLKKMLLENAHKPLFEQKLILEQTFDNWKGNINQVDDVLVLGVKI